MLGELRGGAWRGAGKPALMLHWLGGDGMGVSGRALPAGASLESSRLGGSRKSMGLGLEFHLCRLLALRPRACDLTTLNLSFLGL